MTFVWFSQRLRISIFCYSLDNGPHSDLINIEATGPAKSVDLTLPHEDNNGEHFSISNWYSSAAK